MKSKLRFALDGNNKAVIDAHIEHSDDLRDEVALQFRQNFKTTGNLATMHFCFKENEQIKITPYGGDIEESKKIASELSLYQLENLTEALSIEKSNRFSDDNAVNCTQREKKSKLRIITSYNKEVKLDHIYEKINSAKNINVGYKLDEIKIESSLNSKEDILALIEFLTISIPCFEK